MLRKFFNALLLCAAFGGQAALAAPVTYDESVSGDINFQSDLFVFDVGLNTISGTLRFVFLYDSNGQLTGVSIDTDPIRFTLSPNTVVISASVASSPTPISESTQTGAILWRLLDNLGQTASQTCQVLISGSPCFGFSDFLSPSGGDLFAGAMPLSLAFVGGIFAVDSVNLSAGGLPGNTVGFDYAYTLTFTAQSVPEPGTLALLGLGLVGLTALRRRKH